MKRIIPNVQQFIFLILFFAFYGNGSAQCTITGNVNSSSYSCASFIGCTTVFIGDGTTLTTLNINSGFDLSCLGPINFVIKNNATLTFGNGANDRLTLGARSGITVETGGNISGGPGCNASDRIYIGADLVATCDGNAGSDFSFAQVVANGGIAGAAGTIGTNQTICSGSTPAALTSIADGTGSGTITYEWQTNAGGSFANIPLATSNGYSPPALTATTSYRRRTVTSGPIYSAYTNSVTITVNPNVTPTFTAVPDICSGATLSALPTTSTNGITGTWSPALNNTATTTYTFTPTAGLCATTTTLAITVNPNITPTFTAVPAICSGATLSALPTTSNNGITGTWAPALNNTATTTYTFTPNTGQCATTTTLAITVNPNVTPTFTAVAPICSGGALSALPTTSNNGITGTWSPALNNTATTTYTFTPTAGLCATTTTMTITVNPNVTPTFTAVAPICSGATLSALPTTSTNGIAGTWAPALNNTATTTYTFTPTVGQCATTTTLTITVNPNVTPTFTSVPAICSGATLSALPTTSNNGITGTWAPALNNTATTTYTFTPTVGQCATTTTLAITVNPNVTPTFTAVPAICSGATLSALPTTSNNGITGTWSPALNNTATTTYTFTPTAGLCATTTTLSITVNPFPGAAGTISGTATVCQGQNGVTYSVPAIADATGYNWSLPFGASIVSGANTNTITVNYAVNAVSGNITVQGTNACGSGTISSNFPVTLNLLPDAAGIISGFSNAFRGDVDLPYSVPPINNASSYTWSYSGTGVIIFGTTNSVLLSFSLATATSGILTVKGVNACGNGVVSQDFPIDVTTAPPAAPPTIVGPNTVCLGQNNVTYSVGNNVNTYFWTVPSGAIITSGQGTKSITVNYSSSAVSGNVVVQLTNNYGPFSGGLPITVVPLPATPTITAGGPTTFCTGGSVILTSSSAIGNTWSTGETTQSITVSTDGLYTVRVRIGTCDSGLSAATTVIVNPLPATPTITAGGSTTFCAGGSVTLTSSAGTSYLWSTGATTASISPTTAGSYTVQVTNASGCQSASSLATTVTVNALPATPTIIADGPTTFCDGGSVILTSSSAIGNTWSTGETTQSITVSTDGLYTVRVRIGTCDSGLSAATAVTVNPNVTPTFVAVPAICSGVTLSALPTTSDNGITGTWSPALNNTATTTYTFTPTVGQCATTATLIITVIPLPSSPTVGTITNVTCSSTTGSVVLNNLPSTGNWTISSTPTVVGLSGISGSGTSTTIGGLPAGDYTFTVDNGTCTSSPTPIVPIADASSTTWNGSSWSNGAPDATKNAIVTAVLPNSPFTSDLTACALTISSGVIATVSTGVTLTITNAVTTNGQLIFENNASLVQTTNATNTGVIEYRRTSAPMKNFDYTYWSSPVADQNIVALSPNTLWDKYFRYDPAIGWVFHNGLMTPGVGFIIRTPKPGTYGAPYPETVTMPYAQPVAFKGVPNNGNVPFVVGANQYNLIGNPYPSALDATKFMQDNSGIIYGALYFWTHNTAIQQSGSNYIYVADDYATYTLTGGVAATTGGLPPSGNIAAGQSFFVGNTAAGSFQFTNAMRVAGNNTQFFKQASTKKTAAIEKNRVWLNLTNSGGAFKQLLVGYITGATNDWDNLYDGPTFDGQPFVDFYSINKGQNLSIQGRALPFESTDEVPLGYRSTIAGTFDISINNRDGVLASQEIWLQDKKINTIHDLTKGKYTFTAINGVENSRFVLKYVNTTLVNKPSTNKTVLVTVKSNETIVSSSAEGIAQVQVFDLLGRLVYTKSNINAQTWSITGLPIGGQALIVKTTLTNGEISSKKIIL